VCQSQRLDEASGWPIHAVSVQESRGPAVSAGVRQRDQNLWIHALHLSSERNGCRIQCTDALVKAWRQQLLQFRERSHRRLADA
jgi:hypothetical protein